jgi:hypothetical protein
VWGVAGKKLSEGKGGRVAAVELTPRRATQPAAAAARRGPPNRRRTISNAISSWVISWCVGANRAFLDSPSTTSAQSMTRSHEMYGRTTTVRVSVTSALPAVDRVAVVSTAGGARQSRIRAMSSPVGPFFRTTDTSVRSSLSLSRPSPSASSSLAK